MVALSTPELWSSLPTLPKFTESTFYDIVLNDGQTRWTKDEVEVN